MTGFFSTSQATSRGRRVKLAPPRPVATRSKGPLQRDRILAFLEGSGRAYSSTDIDEALGLPPAAASKRLTDLVREGKIRAVDGLYQAVYEATA